ncbi:argininosuccinate synthase [Kitasatospora herbaricolor]|uniref:argininosuccinate synthase n=1 Tax=Kitasatospora herbaricolor TaxID=68217 RepID=UPI00174C1941|nr:argininosuccinate synthase [Kitasatospora herbaricolor]MDQ0309540.1 argininosuccinate synthase [Kitasatospora herbaricolor]GGV01171.1 argininosuccinate synthase [Kitasatospora herbaricolor]
MKIVLAYSGGLDTSVALHWLKERYNAEVVAFCADIGQIESLETVRERAVRTGASEVFVEPLTDRYLNDFALPALRSHARYENKYLVAAPLSRPLIAQRMVEIAHEVGADAVAHGATGKGNDQVRFFTSVTALDPGLKVLAPVIDWELRTREEELDYARKHGIQVSVGKENPYSIDTNIWGTSIECGELDDITLAPPARAWQLTNSPQQAPDQPRQVTIGFESGHPVTLDGEKLGLTELVTRLNAVAAQHGVGRVDIVESRIVGFKTRGIYEAPAATLLMAAHEELEAIVLDRETLHHKQGMAARYAELVYYGYWFSDLRRAMDAFTDSLQGPVTGEVTLELYKGSFAIAGRRSPFSRYSGALATYEAGDTFNHQAGAGFAYVWSLPLTRPAAGGQV